MKISFRSVIVFALLSISFFIFGLWLGNKDQFEKEFKQKVKPIALFFHQLFNPVSNAKELDVLFSQDDWSKLLKIRQDAIENKLFVKGKDQYFPVQIFFDSVEANGKARLKGGKLDHLQTEKWSLRIKLSEGETYNNMQTFSLQHPNTRNFIYEWFFHKVLEIEGLNGLEYDFINVKINNEEKGLFAMEEHFNNYYLKKKNKDQSVILKFNDELRLASMLKAPHIKYYNELNNSGSYLSSNIEWYKTNFIDTTLQNALNLLELLRANKKKVNDCININEYAKFFALCDILGSQHALAWRNLRLLYDFNSEKFSPIGYDGDSGIPIHEIIAFKYNLSFDQDCFIDFNNSLFQDTLFYKSYISQIEKYSRSGVVEKWIDILSDEMKNHMDLINAEFPGFHFNTEVYEQNRNTMNASIHSSKLAHVHFQSNKEDTLILAIGNIQQLPITINKIIIGSEEIEFNHLIFGKKKNLPVEYKNYKLAIDSSQNIQSKNILVEISVFGLDHTVLTKVSSMKQVLSI